jgi:hypothetical protein
MGRSDNDGDIDLAISGLDDKDNYVSVFIIEKITRNFVKELKFMDSDMSIIRIY